LDAARAQLTGDEVIAERGISQGHVAGPEGVVHLPQGRGPAGALARVRRDRRVVTRAGRRRPRHGGAGRRGAPARPLRRRPREPRVVATGPNARPRHPTPRLPRTSRVRTSVRTSASGGPRLRAKRARTACKLVMNRFGTSGRRYGRWVGGVLSAAAGRRPSP